MKLIRTDTLRACSAFTIHMGKIKIHSGPIRSELASKNRDEFWTKITVRVGKIKFSSTEFFISHVNSNKTDQGPNTTSKIVRLLNGDGNEKEIWTEKNTVFMGIFFCSELICFPISELESNRASEWMFYFPRAQ
jgi:hypothetical protein